MDITLTTKEHNILARLSGDIVPLSVGGRGNPMVHIHSPAGLIDITRGLCIMRIMGSATECETIDVLFEKLEDIFGLPFSDLNPNPYGANT